MNKSWLSTRRRLSMATGLAFSLLAIGCSSAPPPAPEETTIAPVGAENPRLLTLAEWTDLLGVTQPLPNHVARVTAVLEGQVLPFSQGQVPTEGQEVKAGDVVVRLDPRLVEERRKQADIAVRLAESEVNRLASLMRTGTAGNPVPLVSPVERDKAQLALEDAQSKRRAIDEEMRYYTLRAPIAGRIGMMQVVPGQTVPPGTTVAEIVDLAEIDVLAFVPPHTAARLTLNLPARVMRLGADGKETPGLGTGKVVFIAVQAQPETGNFAVKVRFPNKGLELLANTVVRVQVQTRPEEPRLTVPDSALMEDTDPPTVVVVDDLQPFKTKEGGEEERGKARKLRARIGVRDRTEHRVEILGLETEKKEPVAVDTALFVVKGGNGLQDGDPVKLEKDEDD